MSSPWAKIAAPAPVNFTEIISEQVAYDLQLKENAKQPQPKPAPSLADDAIAASTATTLESDAMIAQLLQAQFDREHDDNLKKSEAKYNGASKVSISFDNYRRTPLNPDFESESEDEEIVDVRDRRDWDRFDTMKREVGSIPARGYKLKDDGSMVTKHDVTIDGRKNACKMLSFPPTFHTGDGENFDLRLSNKVFNSLKMHSKHAESRRHKMRDKKEDRATAEFGLDEYTRLILYKLINNESLEAINGVISIGKEAVILHADANASYETPLPPECVIKVFKTTLSEFKQRDKYIKDDHRFKDRIGKQTARKTVHIWAEKEKHNLIRVRNAGISCPEVVALKKHVLVMSFIGSGGKPAPKLKHASLDEAELIVAYDQVVTAMKMMFHQAELVHADLSEYNILWHEGGCYFIDVSQSVMTVHENAFFFLMRDCNNVTNFFSKKKVVGVYSAEELFKAITGYNYDEKKELLDLQEKFKMKPHLVDKPGVESEYNFEKAWERTMDPDLNELLVEPISA